MESVKNFKTFISESVLFEGRYNTIVNDIVSDVMDLIKKTNTGEKKYNGIKISYSKSDDVPSFFELIEKGKFLKVGEYRSEKSDVDVTVNLLLIRDEVPVYPGDFIVTGDADDQAATIYVEISLDPASEPNCYSDIVPDLKDVVRHEIEHLTQRGWNEKSGKYMRSNQGARNRIFLNPDLRYKYYKLKDEVDANLQGLYTKAKTLKRPFKDVVMDFLDRQTKMGIIPEERKFEIYNLWRRRAKTIGGLPLL